MPLPQILQQQQQQHALPTPSILGGLSEKALDAVSENLKTEP
jgi:hypothetical protein